MDLWTLYQVVLALNLPSVDEVVRHVIRAFLTVSTLKNDDYIRGLKSALEWYSATDHFPELPDYDEKAVAEEVYDEESDTDTDSPSGKQISFQPIAFMKKIVSTTVWEALDCYTKLRCSVMVNSSRSSPPEASRCVLPLRSCTERLPSSNVKDNHTTTTEFEVVS